MNTVPAPSGTSSNSTVASEISAIDIHQSSSETTALMDAHIGESHSRHNVSDKRSVSAGERPARKSKRPPGYGV